MVDQQDVSTMRMISEMTIYLCSLKKGSEAPFEAVLIYQGAEGDVHPDLGFAIAFGTFRSADVAYRTNPR